MNTSCKWKKPPMTNTMQNSTEIVGFLQVCVCLCAVKKTELGHENCKFHCEQSTRLDWQKTKKLLYTTTSHFSFLLLLWESYLFLLCGQELWPQMRVFNKNEGGKFNSTVMFLTSSYRRFAKPSWVLDSNTQVHTIFLKVNDPVPALMKLCKS